MSEHAMDGLELDSAHEHKVYDDVRRLMFTSCERLCSLCGGSALVSAVAKIRYALQRAQTKLNKAATS